MMIDLGARRARGGISLVQIGALVAAASLVGLSLAHPYERVWLRIKWRPEEGGGGSRTSPYELSEFNAQKGATLAQVLADKFGRRPMRLERRLPIDLERSVGDLELEMGRDNKWGELYLSGDQLEP